MNTKGKKEARLGEMSRLFKMMGDETRLRILMALHMSPLCVTHICQRVDMSQSAVSHQLALLRSADLVRVVRKGKQVVYSLSDEHVQQILDMVSLHVGEVHGNEA